MEFKYNFYGFRGRVGGLYPLQEVKYTNKIEQWENRNP